jgi:hypothetical protein
VNQYPQQLSGQLQHAIRNNAATFVRTVEKDGHYRLEVTRREDMDLKPPPVYVVEPSRPLGPGDPKRADEVRRRSRERYWRSPEQGSDAPGAPEKPASDKQREERRRPADVEEE